MAHIVARQAHPPAPSAPGGEDRRSPAAVVLAYQQGQRLPVVAHREQRDGSGLERPEALEIRQLRQFRPERRIALRIRIQAANQGVAALARQFDLDLLALEGGFVGFKRGRQGVHQFGVLPASRSQSVGARQHQQRPAAATDEIADRDLLLGREEGRLEAADDQGVVSEQRFRGVGKPVLELLRCVDSLSIELVRRRAQHGDQLHAGILMHRAAHELVLPARLALRIENAATSTRYVQHVPAGVVPGNLLVRQRLGREHEVAHAGLARAEIDPLAAHRLAGRQGDRLARQHAGPVAHGDARDPILLAVVTQRELRADTRARQGPRRDRDLRQLDVAGNALSADSDRMHRHVVLANLRHQLAPEAAGIVRAVAGQQDRAQGHRGRLAQDAEDRFADAAARGGRREMLRDDRVDAPRRAAETVKQRAELALERWQDLLAESGYRLLQPTLSVDAERHAARGVQQHGNRVLATLQRLNRQRRLPHHEQD